MTWPGAVYCLEVGIIGTDGVLTIDDTHRDMVLAVSASRRSEGYAPDKTPAGRFPRQLSARRHGARRIARPDGATRPMSWLNRVALGLPTQAATAAEAHNNLMLTKALDLSAKRKQPVKLPLAPDEERAAA